MDLLPILRFIGALAFVLGLLALLAYGLRRWGHLVPGLTAGGIPASRKMARLAVVETLVLDARRRLVLVRRDGVEHLLLVGPESQSVIEAGIVPAAAKGQD